MCVHTPASMCSPQSSGGHRASPGLADNTATLPLENRPRRGGVSCLKSHKKSSQSRPTKFTYDALEVWGSRLLISFAQTLHIPILRQPTPELKGSLEVKWAMKKGKHETVQQLGKTATKYKLAKEQMTYWSCSLPKTLALPHSSTLSNFHGCL